MLLSRNIAPNVGRFPVRESVVRVLIVVATKSSGFWYEQRTQEELYKHTNEVFSDAAAICLGLAHLKTLTHFPVPVSESCER